MSEYHLAYLCLGSNIKPEENLRRALTLLSEFGEINKVSSVRESEPIGTKGSNYLNACVQFRSSFSQADLKEQVIESIESLLGRKRSEDKYAPRTIDIDLVIFDDKAIGTEWINLAYVVVPLADIYPGFQIPNSGRTVSEIATRLRQVVRMERRQGILG